MVGLNSGDALQLLVGGCWIFRCSICCMTFCLSNVPLSMSHRLIATNCFFWLTDRLHRASVRGRRRAKNWSFMEIKNIFALPVSSDLHTNTGHNTVHSHCLTVRTGRALSIRMVIYFSLVQLQNRTLLFACLAFCFSSLRLRILSGCHYMLLM